jgi:hypothetical protein
VSLSFLNPTVASPSERSAPPSDDYLDRSLKTSRVGIACQISARPSYINVIGRGPGA